MIVTIRPLEATKVQIKTGNAGAVTVKTAESRIQLQGSAKCKAVVYAPRTQVTLKQAEASEAVVENTKAVVRIIQSRAVAAQALAHFERIYDQAATEWIVNHNFGRCPLVSVMSLGKVEMDALVTHTSSNQLVVNFKAPQTGIVVVR